MSYAMTQYALGVTPGPKEIARGYRAKAAELDKYSLELSKKWTSELKREVLPCAFVSDILYGILTDIIAPMRKTQLALLGKNSNMFISHEIRIASDLGDVNWRNLAPLLNEATVRGARGELTMKVPLGGRLDFRGQVFKCLAGYSMTYERWAGLMEEQSVLNAIFDIDYIGDALVWFFATSGKAVERALAWVAAGANAIYEPVRKIEALLGKVITVAKWSTLGMLAWYLFFKKKAAAAPA
jgi:hypothetical protein